MKNKKVIITIVVLLMLFVVLLLNINNILKIIYPIKYSDYINKYSKEYNLDPYLVAAVIKTESNYNTNAESAQKARGLMQITGATGKWISSGMKITNFSNDKLFEPEYNIKMGCWYLNDLEKEFYGNTDLVLAAYNGGRGNVNKWLKNSDNSPDGRSLKYIPFKETDKYVKKVKTMYNIYIRLYRKNN